MPDRKNGSCLDLELPGTGLRKGRNVGPGLPYSGEKSQLEPSREGGKHEKIQRKPILDVMKEDQRSAE